MSILKRKYRIRVKDGWECVPEYSYFGVFWTPLRTGIYGAPIGQAQPSFAQDEINADRNERATPDFILEDVPSAYSKTSEDLNHESSEERRKREDRDAVHQLIRTEYR